MTKCDCRYCQGQYKPAVLPNAEFQAFIKLVNRHKEIAAAKRYQPVEVAPIVMARRGKGT